MKKEKGGDGVRKPYKTLGRIERSMLDYANEVMETNRGHIGKTIKANINEIADLFHIPPEKIIEALRTLEEQGFPVERYFTVDLTFMHEYFKKHKRGK